MTALMDILRRFKRDETGTTLVEMAIVMPLLLLLIFGILEYGRLFWITSASQKAMAIAVRTAAVRPPVCAGVPTIITAASTPPNTPAPRFGTVCRAGGACANGGEQVCALNIATTTGQEIWDRVSALMPPGSTPANIRMRYTFDGRMGFVGGPYSPVVTAELVDLNEPDQAFQFQFVLPLGPLAALASNAAYTSPTRISLPSMSASLPGEDLALGVTN